MTLMLIVCFNYVLKQTYRKWPAIMLSATVAALFVAFMWPFAIEQSKSQIQDWLANQALMKDIAVLLSIDVIIQITFCMLAAHVMTSGHLNKKTIVAYKILRFIPSLLFYPVLFSGLVMLMFSVHGMEFKYVAWMFSVAIFILVPGLTWMTKLLLPEKDLRLELLFLCNFFILLMGIISTVNIQPVALI